MGAALQAAQEEAAGQLVAVRARLSDVEHAAVEREAALQDLSVRLEAATAELAGARADLDRQAGAAQRARTASEAGLIREANAAAGRAAGMEIALRVATDSGERARAAAETLRSGLAEKEAVVSRLRREGSRREAEASAEAERLRGALAAAEARAAAAEAAPVLAELRGQREATEAAENRLADVQARARSTPVVLRMLAYRLQLWRGADASHVPGCQSCLLPAGARFRGVHVGGGMRSCCAEACLVNST